MIYLDNAATTKISELAIKKMKELISQQYANPSAIYDFAMESKRMLESAREKIAKVLSVSKDEIYFTSGGSESDNWAIRGIAEAYQHKGKHIITTTIEHKAVINTCKYLEKQGFDVTYLDVDNKGFVNPKQLEEAIRKDTILISIMYANNEIGTIMPINELAIIAEKHNILFHTDAVQAFGHINIDCNKYPISLLSASGHKCHGPKGVGFLYIKNGVKISPLIYGGSQEMGLRAGTENVVNIVGMAYAAEESVYCMEETQKEVTWLRNYLIEEVISNVENVYLVGDLKYRLPNSATLCFRGIDGLMLVDRMSQKDICISTGSACNMHNIQVSHVLTAVGLSEADANATVRLSLSKNTTRKEIDLTITALKESVYEMRQIYG